MAVGLRGAGLGFLGVWGVSWAGNGRARRYLFAFIAAARED